MNKCIECDRDLESWEIEEEAYDGKCTDCHIDDILEEE